MLAAKQLGLNISRKTKTMQVIGYTISGIGEGRFGKSRGIYLLGKYYSKSNNTVKDVINRLHKAKSSVVQLNELWSSPNISKKPR